MVFYAVVSAKSELCRGTVPSNKSKKHHQSDTKFEGPLREKFGRKGTKIEE